MTKRKRISKAVGMETIDVKDELERSDVKEELERMITQGLKLKLGAAEFASPFPEKDE